MLPDNILQLMMDGLVADGVAVRDGDAYKLVPVTIYNINQFVDDHKLKIKQASPEVQSVICECWVLLIVMRAMKTRSRQH
jgi:hypothetical protein